MSVRVSVTHVENTVELSVSTVQAKRCPVCGAIKEEIDFDDVAAVQHEDGKLQEVDVFVESVEAIDS